MVDGYRISVFEQQNKVRERARMRLLVTQKKSHCSKLFCTTPMKYLPAKSERTDVDYEATSEILFSLICKSRSHLSVGKHWNTDSLF